MTASIPAHTSRTLDLGDALTITVDEAGDRTTSGGGAVLLLHGGGGPRTVAGLAGTLAEHTYVITPIHPGFDGTPRPDWFDRMDDLAVAYLDLLDVLDLGPVLVVGSSIGGWIAAEMALRDTRQRISGLVLLNAVGIEGDGPDQVVDTRALSPVELGALAFHNPALRPDPSSLSPEQRAATAANQRTLATYAGDLFTHDPKLRRRLHRVTVPALVVWGEQDGVAPVGYGRTYAEAFPDSRFVPVPEAGHFPHIEQPARTMAAIDEFIDTEKLASTQN
jgi:pimeloyl-ACP methyl ester carboxylesterase